MGEESWRKAVSSSTISRALKVYECCPCPRVRQSQRLSALRRSFWNITHLFLAVFLCSRENVCIEHPSCEENQTKKAERRQQRAENWISNTTLTTGHQPQLCLLLRQPPQFWIDQHWKKCLLSSSTALIAVKFELVSVSP